MNKAKEVSGLVEQLFTSPQGAGYRPFMELSPGSLVWISCEGENLAYD